MSEQAKAAFNAELAKNNIAEIGEIPKAWYSHFHTIALGLASQHQLTNQGATNAN